MKIKNAKEKLITCLLIAVIVAVMYLFHIPCPFKAIFSIPCPGCGMTRAYLSLLSFDFVKALEYNPMFWSVPVLFVFYFFDGRVFKKKPGKKTGTVPFPTAGSYQATTTKVKEPYTHKCTVCGRTDVTNPELEFRYCSRCNGYHCYCEDHINNHTHIE